MQRRIALPGLCLVLAFAGGCKSHPLTDYRALDKAGMNSGVVEQLKALNVSDPEVAQLLTLKNSGVSDATCLALVAAARQHQHDFSASSAITRLSGAGYSDEQILAIAAKDKIELVSGEAITLRLIGLSEPTVQNLLQRQMDGVPTLSSGEISRLKNTGLTEKQILERIDAGMTDEQADVEIAARESHRDHSNVSFIRVHGRRR